MNKQIIIGVAIALVCAGGGYWAGKSSVPAVAPRGAFTGAAGGNFAGRMGAGRTAGNAVFGTVLSKDANGITVELGGGPNATSTNGAASGSRIILLNTSTQVLKTTAGSLSDISVGTGITASGTTNSDGSLTATSVQIRPAGSGPRGQ